MASVENRGNGKWRLIVSGGYDEQHKQRKITKTICLDPKMTPLAQKREALKQAAALETDYGRGTLTAAGKMSMNELFGLYTTSKSIADKTRKAYQWLYDDAIREPLGTVTVQDLTPRRLQKFFSDLAARDAGNRSKTGKLSGNTRKHYYTLLRALLNFAIKLQVITVLYDSGQPGAINTAVNIMNANGITLPALHYNNSMNQAFGGYLSSTALPTTVFVDQDGHFVKCVNRAKSYDEWCAIINGML